MKTKKIIFLFLALALIFTTACGGNQTSTEDDSTENGTTESGNVVEGDDTLTVAIELDISSIDPAGHNETVTAYVTNMITSRLFTYDEEMNVQPQLAESWEYLSDNELKIKIHEGVKFHDGSEMKAEDVKASIERAVESPKVAYVVNKVDNVDIVDDYTVIINTKTPFAPLIGNLVHPGCSILSKKQIDSGDFEHINGSGPYKFVSWQSGNEIVLEKHGDYFEPDKASDFEKLVYRVIPEGSSRTIALEAGDVDLVTALETNDYDRVNENQDLEIIERMANHIWYLALNVEKEPFDNKLVRQAMNYAVNKESVLEVAVDGHGKPLRSVTPEPVLGWVDNPYEYNPEKAKEMLAEAGYGDGDLEVTINSYGDDKSAPVIQANFMEIGINAKVNNMDRGAFMEMNNRGDHQCSLNGWTTSPDPDRFFASLLHSNGVGTNNYARYADPEMDKLIEEGSSTIDEATREKIYNKVHEKAMDDAIWVPLYSKILVMGGKADYSYDGVLDPMWNINFNLVRK